VRKLRIGPDFTVFILFFGGALFEALRHGDWLMATIFVALGLLFLRAEYKRSPL
jgi:hypothetical protein